jgi:hypothetical protein
VATLAGAFQKALKTPATRGGAACRLTSTAPDAALSLFPLIERSQAAQVSSAVGPHHNRRFLITGEDNA